jgi:hypothetical protein
MISYMMPILNPSPGKYARTPAGYAAWLYDGNKGDYNDFLAADKKRAYTLMQIDQLLGKLSDKDLRDVYNYLKSKFSV